MLKKVSRHYKTNEVLSDELISTLVRRCAGTVVLLAAIWTDLSNSSAAMSTGGW